MCEFCNQHSEGKKWYLEMKNYSQDLLHQELNADAQRITGARTRYEWNNRFWELFIMPAITGVHPSEHDRSFGARTLEEWKVEHFGQVIPIEDVEQVLARVDSITRLPCGCRFLSTGKTDRRYCFGIGMDALGVLGRFPEAKTSLEVLERAEAMALIRKFDEEGLMHSIWTGVTPYVIGICNCDYDCGAYRGYLASGKGNFFRAEYIAQVDIDQCQGCRDCMSRCQFGAMFYSSTFERVFIDPRRCFGCGACRAACPNAAIELIARQSVPAAAEVW
jgi:ferredoxin